ncbi:MAG: PAS domain S-box protein [Chloroflexota bacterium]|nr:PAS domain S-box protein [Chloroflexota bacterium]
MSGSPRGDGGETYRTVQASELLLQEIKERKQVELAQKESEGKFRILAEQSPNMIFINKKGRVVYANKKCEEVMGYKREEFSAPDFDFFILIAPEHQELVKSSFSKHVAGEETEPYEYALVTRDGGRIEAIITTRLIDYEGDRAILGTVTDITERVRMEKALQESEEKFRSLVENSHAGILLLDKTHRIIYANDELSRIAGYSSEEIVGQNFRAFLDDEAQQYATDLYVRRQRGGEVPSRYELEIIRKDGEKRQAEVSSTVIVDSAGNVRTVVQVLDITERKRVEGALQTANERYEMATQAAKVGVWDWNIETGEFYLDPNIKAFLGYSDEEIPNDIEVWTTYVHPEDRQPVMEAAQAHLEGRTPEYIYEHRMLHRDGSVRWVLVRGTAIRDAQGKAIRLVGTDTDITKRKQAKQALQESEKKFRSIVEQSHDAITLFDEQGIIVEWNSAMEQLTGVGWAQAIGQYAWDVQFQALPELERSPERHARIKAVLQQFFETGQAPWEGQLQEANIIHADGTRRVVQQNSFTIKTAQGFMLGSINRDITERKRAEQVLTRRVKELAALNQIAQMVTTMTDLPEVLGRVSQVMKTLFDARIIYIILPTTGENEMIFVHGFQREVGILEPSLLDPALTEMPQFRRVLSQPESLVVSASDSQPLADFPLLWQALSQTELRADQVSDKLLQLLPPVAFEALAPGSLNSIMLIPLVMRGTTTGFMFVATDQASRSYTADDVSVAETIAGDIASAVESTRFLEQAQAVAVAEERSRLARELHDSVTQTIYSVSMMAEALPQVWDRSPADAKRNMAKLRQMTLVALTEMRALLFELRPSALEETSLDALLHQLRDVMTERGRIPVELTIEGEGDIPQDIKIALYRTAQEAFTNILKHAEATQVVVTLRKDPGQVILTIRDNGQGFEPESMPVEHLGIGIMRERAKGIGARFLIESAPGEGTHISVTWPDPEVRG